MTSQLTMESVFGSSTEFYVVVEGHNAEKVKMGPIHGPQAVGDVLYELSENQENIERVYVADAVTKHGISSKGMSVARFALKWFVFHKLGDEEEE